MRRLLLASSVAALLAAPLAAQPPAGGLPQPRLNVVMPPGAKVGTTVEVTVTGLDLDEPRALIASHPGIKAELVVPPAPPPDPKKAAPMPMPNIGAPGAVATATLTVTVAPHLP